MYSGLMQKPLRYVPPWSKSLATRLADLDAGHSGRPRIAWIYPEPDTSTFRYRVFNMVECLQADGRAAASWFRLSEAGALHGRLRSLSVLVLVRIRYDETVARLVLACRAAGVRVLFDCDDLVFDTRCVHLLVDTLDLLLPDADNSPHWDHWFGLTGRTEATLRLCDGGITTNRFLADRMSQTLDSGRVGIVPNYLNRQQQDVSRTLLTTKRNRYFKSDGPVTIGYFSGTPTHNRDFAVVAPALAGLLADDPDVNVRIVGFLNWSAQSSFFASRIEFVPLQDWLNLQRVIAEVEINIAPLQENIFTNSKSELKFFEAAAVGTWTLATPTVPFATAIRDGETGTLVRAHEWDTALRDAVALARDTSAYALRMEATADIVNECYGWNKFADRILSVVMAGKSDRTTV